MTSVLEVRVLVEPFGFLCDSVWVAVYKVLVSGCLLKGKNGCWHPGAEDPSRHELLGLMGLGDGSSLHPCIGRWHPVPGAPVEARCCGCWN